eukprot:gene10069-10444_t
MTGRELNVGDKIELHRNMVEIKNDSKGFLLKEGEEAEVTYVDTDGEVRVRDPKGVELTLDGSNFPGS